MARPMYRLLLVFCLIALCAATTVHTSSSSLSIISRDLFIHVSLATSTSVNQTHISFESEHNFHVDQEGNSFSIVADIDPIESSSKSEMSSLGSVLQRPTMLTSILIGCAWIGMSSRKYRALLIIGLMATFAICVQSDSPKFVEVVITAPTGFKFESLSLAANGGMFTDNTADNVNIKDLSINFCGSSSGSAIKVSQVNITNSASLCAFSVTALKLSIAEGADLVVTGEHDSFVSLKTPFAGTFTVNSDDPDFIIYNRDGCECNSSGNSEVGVCISGNSGSSLTINGPRITLDLGRGVAATTPSQTPGLTSSVTSAVSQTSLPSRSPTTTASMTPSPSHTSNTINGCTREIAQRSTGTVNFIQSFHYTPKCVVVPLGGSLTFTGSFVYHPMIGGVVSNGVITPATSGPFVPAIITGSLAVFNFPTAGVYPYYCISHALSYEMYGVVYVE